MKLNFHIQFKRQRLYAFLSVLLAVLMLVSVLGTTAVYAAVPIIPPNQTFDVNENSATGTAVGTVVTTGDPVSTFSIVAGNNGNAFSIDAGGNIAVQTGTAIDFETMPVFTLTIQATNDDGSSQEDVVINVNDMNDAPEVSPSHSFTFAENSAIGTPVGTIVATDPDGNDLNYAIVQWISAPGPFLVNTDSGVITATAQIDYETDQTSYILIVRVSDGGRSSNTTVTIQVTDANDPPVAIDDDGYTVIEDNVLSNATPSVLANDTDQDDVSLEAVLDTQPANGAVSLNVDGTFTYTPTAEFDGNDTFTYFAYDGTDNSVLAATVTISVTGDNDAPTAVDDFYSTPEETTLTVLAADGILKNDTDPEHDSLTAALFEDVDPSKGTLFLAFDGAFVFTPTLNYAGIVTFTYYASDFPANIPGLDSVAPATVTINVSNENDPPVVADETWAVAENAATNTLVGTLAVTDPDGETAFTYAITNGNTNSAFSLNSAGELRVATSSALDFETTPTFTLTVTAEDAGNLTGEATVIVNLNDVNEAPTAVADPNYTTPEDTPLTVTAPGVLGNDSDPDTGDNLTAHLDTDVSSGTLALALDGSFIYTPTLNFSGVVTFTYHAEDDDNATSNTTTATITVQSVNDAPVAVDDPGYTTNEDTLLTVPAAGVLSNDSDVDMDGITAVLDTNVSSGTLTLNANGSFSYNPALNASGVVTFTYHALDNGTPPLPSNTATVTITVTAVNDAPVINNQSFALDENSAIGTVVGTAVASDVDNGSLTFGFIPGGSGDGSFGISDSGQITVTNNAALDMETTQSFTLTVVVSDTEPLIGTAVITINLNNVNEFDPEITAGQEFTITESAANNSSVGTVAADDTDWDESVAAYAITGGNTDSIFSINNSGLLQVANNTNLDFETTNTYTLTIQATDNGTNPGTRSGIEEVVVHITDANDAPVIDNVTTNVNTINESEAITVTVSFSDPDTGDAHTVDINWGDGQTSTVNATAGMLVITDTHTYQDDNPSGTSSDNYTIAVTVTDDGTPNESDTDNTTSVTVNNVAPVLTNILLSPTSADEGDSVTLTGDIADVGILDTFSLLVNWGDGTSNTYNYAAGTTSFSENHVFVDDGQPLTVNLTLTDDDTGEVADSIMITVGNLPPVADAGLAQIVNDGDSVVFAGSFTDPGSADTHTYDWDFGDATSSTGSLSPSHVYPGIGVYTATLTVTDDDSGVGTDDVVITVISPSDIVATKTVTGDFEEEGTVFYTITMTNNGDSTQLDNTGDELTDVLPAQLTLVDAQVISGGGTVTAVVATNTVTWNGSIASDSSVVIEIEAAILLDTKGETVSNQATIAYDADGNGSNEATTFSDDPAVAGNYDPTVFEVQNEYWVFLPIVLNNFISAPDLVVTEIRATSNLIEVVIENQGNAPVVNSFWVDFYINPNPVPMAANDLWPESGPEGLAWGVTDSLPVGASMTLIYSTAPGAPNLYFVAEESLYHGSLPAGTPVYAQADSARADIGYGAIPELDELSGGPYNNILGGTAVTP